MKKKSNFAGPGFEPRLTAPEAVVLPLDDPAIYVIILSIYYFLNQMIA